MPLGFAAALLIFGVLAIWKRRMPRVVAWCLLFAGIGLSGVVIGITGPIAWSIGGASLSFAIVVGLAYLFYEEAVKRNGIHKIRTNIVAFALGVMLVGLGGSIGAKVSGLFTGTAGRVGTTTSNLVNSNGR
jgi:hypothetical protein